MNLVYQKLTEIQKMCMNFDKVILWCTPLVKTLVLHPGDHSQSEQMKFKIKSEFRDVLKQPTSHQT